MKGIRISADEAFQERIRWLLRELGEDPDREGLLKTPERVEKMYKELTSGYRLDPNRVTNKAIFKSGYNEIILVKDMDFYSLCEHHLLPFFGTCHIAYIPGGKIIGLSKIPRLVEVFSRRLQVQERLTVQIAEYLEEVLEPKGVAVVMDGFHLCVAMRGAKKSRARMVTSSLTGVFKEDSRSRAEVLSLIHSRARG